MIKHWIELLRLWSLYLGDSLSWLDMSQSNLLLLPLLWLEQFDKTQEVPSHLQYPAILGVEISQLAIH